MYQLGDVHHGLFGSIYATAEEATAVKEQLIKAGNVLNREFGVPEIAEDWYFVVDLKDHSML